jgi:protein-disulfide isomerase
MPTKKAAEDTVNSNPNTLVILLIIFAFFTGYLFFKVQTLEKGKTANTEQPTQGVQQQQQEKTTVNINEVKKLFSKGFIYFGDAKRKALVVEFTDPSCPYCHIASGSNPELAGQAGEQFKYVSQGGNYNPPTSEIKKLLDQKKISYAVIYENGHGNGELAMQALYCAYEKNKFWEVHNLIYSNAGYELINNTVKNDKTQIPQLVSFLSNVIDSNFLSDCLTNGKYSKSVSRDNQEIAPKLVTPGTPAYIVNENIVSGAQDFKQSVESLINNALK